MEEEVDVGPIMHLPNEIINIIMQKLKCRDIVNFGCTCKYFYDLLTSNQFILKRKFKEVLPNDISAAIEKHCHDGRWLDEINTFYSVKQNIYDELVRMSPQFYWRTSEVTLEDITPIWSIVLHNNYYYFYAINILQDLIRQGEKCLEKNYADKPFRMTDVFYAKVVLRYLTQTYLTMKWVHCQYRNELTPEVVVNFFIQWTDPMNTHSDDAVDRVINILVERVVQLCHNETCTGVADNRSVGEKIDAGLIDVKLVLEAVSEVIFGEYEFTIMHAANLNALDIVKVFENRCGNLISVAVIYQAVARCCGVYCELVTFPNHLFLEWRSPLDLTQTYKVDLESGELMPQGRCPFAPTTFRKEYTYNPEALIQYIVSAYLMTMGVVKDWQNQNAVFLLDFLTDNRGDDNPYREFLPNLHALVDFKSSPELDIPLNLEYMYNEHLNIIDYLVNMNRPPVHFTREVTVKHHHPNVKFAVGLLAYHKKRDYLCVIRGWDLDCAADWRRRVDIDLEFGLQQPFYSVIAVDQSERYVAQENLIGVDRPTRLIHLEDAIAKEFCYFDGVCYVPNLEKNQEYPDDEKIRQVHRDIAEQKEISLREAI